MKWIKGFGGLLVVLLFVSMVIIDHNFNEDKPVLIGISTIDDNYVNDNFIVVESEKEKKEDLKVFLPSFNEFVFVKHLGKPYSLEKTGDRYKGAIIVLVRIDGDEFIYVFQGKEETQPNDLTYKNLSWVQT